MDEIAVAPGLLLGGAVIVESGSNTDGEWIRFGNGLQACWIASLLLIYHAAHMLRKTWTYPKPFVERPAVIPVAAEYSSVNAAREIDIINYSPPTNTHAVIAVHTSASLSPYSSGDTRDTTVFAIGRWK